MIKILIVLIAIGFIALILKSRKKIVFKIADIEKMESFVNDPNVTIVDTRSKLFADAYPIDKAINIPHLEFYKYKHLLPDDRSSTIVFYCRDTKCQLSGKSALKAIAEGYTDTYVFEQGAEGWYKYKGLDIPTIDIIEEMGIGKEEFLPFYKSNKDQIVLIDVNDQGFYQSGHLKSAKSMPLGQIPGNIDKLPKNKTIIFYCETGVKSAEAASYLLETELFNPKNIRFLNASVTFSSDGKTEFSAPEK